MDSTLDACLCIGVVVGDEFVVRTSRHKVTLRTGHIGDIARDEKDVSATWCIRQAVLV